MTDRLTQLQVCIDQLVRQYYSALAYINRSHDFLPLSPQDAKVSDPQVHPTSPASKFEADLAELARDIVVKSKQIEVLIDSLPGIGSSESEQLDRARALERELNQAECERQEVLRETAQLLGKCDDLILKVAQAASEIRRSG